MQILNGIILALLLVTSTLADIPGCDYFDTVDLSESKKFPNGSYGYEKLIIPPDQTGEYDYEILVDGEKVDVPKHLRGCACKLGACVRFCCHHNLMLIEGERKCSGDINEAVDFDPFVNITLSDGRVVRKHILDDFVVQRHLPVPCSGHFHLDALHDETNEWTLFENGKLLRTFDNREMSKQEYCLQPHPIENGDNETVLMLVPHNCYEPAPSQWLFNTLRVLSIICLILTIFVYLWLPKLRTLHGYCFVCYMCSLVVTYLLLLADSWKGSWSKPLCQTNGYVGYFAVMASFLWLTIISYDLWNCFRRNNYNVQRYANKHRFLAYSIYAWTTALLLTVVVIIIDSSLDSDMSNELAWMPGVALYNCWVKTDDWSAMLYFHGPIAIQILFNITMFVLTAIRIIEVRRELKSVATAEEPEARVSSDQANYSLFVRLFVIMGVTWTFEIFAYLVQNQKNLEKIFSIFDYINNAQGVIIFILFVLKSRVLKLISNRIRGIEDTSEEDGSEEEIALQERNGFISRNGGSETML